MSVWLIRILWKRGCHGQHRLDFLPPHGKSPKEHRHIGFAKHAKPQATYSKRKKRMSQKKTIRCDIFNNTQVCCRDIHPLTLFLRDKLPPWQQTLYPPLVLETIKTTCILARVFRDQNYVLSPSTDPIIATRLSDPHPLPSIHPSITKCRVLIQPPQPFSHVTNQTC